MTADLLHRVRTIVADALMIDPGTVKDSSGTGTLDAWDSMGQLNVVLSLEQEMGITIPPEDIEAMTNVGMIVTLLRERYNLS